MKFDRIDLFFVESAAARKLGSLLTKVAMNKHFQRIAGLKPVTGVIEKLSNAEVGAKVELTSFSGLMTVSFDEKEKKIRKEKSRDHFRLTFLHPPVIVFGKRKMHPKKDFLTTFS